MQSPESPLSPLPSQPSAEPRLPSAPPCFRLDATAIRNPERLAAFQVVNDVIAASGKNFTAAEFETKVSAAIATRLKIVPLQTLKDVEAAPFGISAEMDVVKKGMAAIAKIAEPLHKNLSEHAKRESSMETAEAEMLKNKEVESLVEKLLQNHHAREALMFFATMVTECTRGTYSTIEGRVRGGMLSTLLCGKGRFETSLPARPLVISRGKKSINLPPPAVIVRDAIVQALSEECAARTQDITLFCLHWENAYLPSQKKRLIDAATAAPQLAPTPTRTIVVTIPKVPDGGLDLDPDVDPAMRARLNENNRALREGKFARHVARLTEEIPICLDSGKDMLISELKPFVNGPFRHRAVNEVVDSVLGGALDIFDQLLEEDVARADLGTLRRAQHVLAPADICLYMSRIPSGYETIEREFKTKRAGALACALLLSEINTLVPLLDGRRPDHQEAANVLFSGSALRSARDIIAAGILGTPLNLRRERAALHGSVRRTLSDPERQDLLQTVCENAGILVGLSANDAERSALLAGAVGRLAASPGDGKAVAAIQSLVEEILGNAGVAPLE